MTLPSVQFLVGRRDRVRRQPEHGIEGGHGVEAAVEAKNVLVEVGLQVLQAHPVVCPVEPLFTLRMAPDAQFEIRQFAWALGDAIERAFPRTWALFFESVAPKLEGSR